MMQLEKRTLPGRVKLVAVALLALSAVVAVWLHASKGASSDSQSLAVEDSTSLLVRVPTATTFAQTKQFCNEQYGDALDVVGFVCDVDDTTPVSFLQVSAKDTGVVYELIPEAKLNYYIGHGSFKTLGSYQISFDAKILGINAELGVVFTMSTSDAPGDGVDVFGRQPGVFLQPGTSKFQVNWSTWNAPVTDEIRDICEGQVAYEAPIGEYVHVTLVNKASGVEFYADDVLRCHKEGDFNGRNDDAVILIAPNAEYAYGLANALIKNFKIKTWN